MVKAGMATSQSIASSVPLPTPQAAWDLVTVPARQGLEAVDILRRGPGDRVGPVLHDDHGDTLGFLVPPGTAAGWDVPGSTCTETDGRGLNLGSLLELPATGDGRPDSTGRPDCADSPVGSNSPGSPGGISSPQNTRSTGSTATHPAAPEASEAPEAPRRTECTCWLLPPGEADLATDPAVLRRALGEAARMIEAADSCR
ncbi:hypothetical protein ACWC10_08280 [Streptomyces sp. NPDC001595]